MKSFIKYLFLFSFPVFIIGGLLEFLIRHIPNDYVLKRTFLDKNSDSIEVLFLGSSHAYYGIDPTFCFNRSFNAAYVAQTLEFDYRILKKYKKHWGNLKCIALPISYFSLFYTLSSGTDAARVKNYAIYYDIPSFYKLSDYSELLSYKLDLNISRLQNYYINQKSSITSSKLGWGMSYSSKIKNDLKESGKTAALRHKMKEEKYFVENANYLKSIIEFAKSIGCRVVLYTPPAFQTYRENLDSFQLQKTIETAIDFSKRYGNVKYCNFLFDSSFSGNDFYDADHLNEIGAKKFTYKLDSFLKQNGF